MPGHLRCLLPTLALLTACPEPIVPLAEEAPACVWNEDCGPYDACLEGVCVVAVESPEETCRASGLTCGLAIAPVTLREVDCSTVANFCAEQRPGTICGADDLCCPESCATAACGETPCAPDGMWAEPCHEACASFDLVQPTSPEQDPAREVPIARSHASLALDPSTERALLFGGLDRTYGGDYRLFGDTWWLAEDGRSWSRATDSAPAARAGAALAFDPSSGTFVLVGGEILVAYSGSGGSHLTEDSAIWRFDGSSWRVLQDPTRLTTSASPALVWSEEQAALLYIGGGRSRALHTLRFDGDLARWEELPFELPEPVWQVDAVALPDGSVLVWGTGGDYASSIDMLWRLIDGRFEELRRTTSVGYESERGCFAALPDGRALLVGEGSFVGETGALLLDPRDASTYPVLGLTPRGGCVSFCTAGGCTVGYGGSRDLERNDLYFLPLP